MIQEKGGRNSFFLWEKKDRQQKIFYEQKKGMQKNSAVR